ncbi:MAG: hypothetical protein ACI4ON_00215 [Clostridia bacterium]
MEQTEEILKKIKAINSDEVKDILKDIVIIDGAIVQEDNLKYKEKVYQEIKNKYYKKLMKLKFEIFKEYLNEKLDNYVDSTKKDINSQIGLLKLFLIRIAALEIVNTQKINEIIKLLNNEVKYRKIKELYDNLDDEILKTL